MSQTLNYTQKITADYMPAVIFFLGRRSFSSAAPVKINLYLLAFLAAAGTSSPTDSAYLAFLGVSAEFHWNSYTYRLSDYYIAAFAAAGGLTDCDNRLTAAFRINFSHHSAGFDFYRQTYIHKLRGDAGASSTGVCSAALSALFHIRS